MGIQLPSGSSEKKIVFLLLVSFLLLLFVIADGFVVLALG
jgi:hypothetical protein